MLSRAVFNRCVRSSSTLSIECKTLSLTSPSPYVLQVEINRPKKLNTMNEGQGLSYARNTKNI